MFNSVQSMQKSVLTVLNDPMNVFDDDDMFCRGAPPLLDACIQELGDMLEKCKVMEQNFKAFLSWIHPEAMKPAKTLDVLLWFDTLIKCIRECNDRNDALWGEDAISVDSSLSAVTTMSPKDHSAINILTEQIDDDSLEEFLAQSAKRIGIHI